MIGGGVLLLILLVLVGLQESGEVYILPPSETAGADGNLVAVARPMSWHEASAYCHANHAGLASIHSGDAQAAAVTLCKQMDMSGVKPRGCWIGMNDDYEEGSWRWSDGTPQAFRAFQPGEPNDYGREHNELGRNNNCGVVAADGSVGACDSNGVGATAAVGEGYVALRFPDGSTKPGAWNDDPNDGKAGHDAAVTSEATAHAGREYGYYPICQSAIPAVADATAKKVWYTPHQRIAPDGKYVSIPISLPWTEAQAFCVSHGYHDLASVHSVEDQASIVNVCAAVANRDGNTGEAAGCWIGMTDRTSEGSWYWSDGSPVDYLAFSPGEPNNWHVQGSQSEFGGQVGGQTMGEDVVSVTFASTRYNGGWNDEHENGKAGLDTNDFTQCFGCSSSNRALGFYVICEKNAPANKHVTSGATRWAEPAPVQSGGAAGGVQPQYGQPAPIGTGKYLAVPFAVTWEEAKAVCEPGGSWPHQQQESYNARWTGHPQTIGLASIHSIADQREAHQACLDIVCPPANGPCSINTAHGDLMSNGLPHGCWYAAHTHADRLQFIAPKLSHTLSCRRPLSSCAPLSETDCVPPLSVCLCRIGLNDMDMEGHFKWSDHSSVDFLHFNPGEPNDWGRGSGAGHGAADGEQFVEMDLRPGRSPIGTGTPRPCTTSHGRCGDNGVEINQGWNDEHAEGVGAHDVLGSGVVGHDRGCFGCQGTYGMYFLCETQQPTGGGYGGSPEWMADYCIHEDGTQAVNCGFPNAVQPGGGR